MTSSSMTTTKTTKFLMIASTIFLSILLLLPILISEQVGGWTRKYTSPIKFTFDSITPDSMTGKVVIVTGANKGIGYVTARELALKGATVIVAARNKERGEEAVASIRSTLTEQEKEKNKGRGDDDDNNNKVMYLPLNLSSLTSIDQFAQAFLNLNLPLHILVLNAGIMMSPGASFIGKNLTYGFHTTEDGFEGHIGVNHIGHFHLTTLLLEKLKMSTPSRVVTLSSSAQVSAPSPEGIQFDTWLPKNGVMPTDYEDGAAYGQSKLANLLFARELAERLHNTGVSSYSCHPGVITTELGQQMYDELQRQDEDDNTGFVKRIGMKFVMEGIFANALFNPEDGALTQLHLATTPVEQLANGGFYIPIGTPYAETFHPQGNNRTLQKLVWEETEKAIRSVRGH